jgi:hypothetical protein
VETINRDQRPSMPLSIVLPAFSALGSGFPAPVEPRVERSLTAVDSGIRPDAPTCVAGGAPIAADQLSEFGEPIYAAVQFRTQGLSVSTEAHESVDAGATGIDQQQGTGVVAAAAMVMSAKVRARGVPPRGRPEHLA